MSSRRMLRPTNLESTQTRTRNDVGALDGLLHGTDYVHIRLHRRAVQGCELVDSSFVAAPDLGEQAHQLDAEALRRPRYPYIIPSRPLPLGRAMLWRNGMWTLHRPTSIIAARTTSMQIASFSLDRVQAYVVRDQLAIAAQVEPPIRETRRRVGSSRQSLQRALLDVGVGARLD